MRNNLFSFPHFGDRYHKVAIITFVKNKSFLNWRFLNVKNKMQSSML